MPQNTNIYPKTYQKRAFHIMFDGNTCNCNTVVPLSGHSTEAAPIYPGHKPMLVHTVNAAVPLTKGHLSNVATISLQIQWSCWRRTTNSYIHFQKA